MLFYPQSVIKHLEDKLQPLIVPAVLENDSGITSVVSVAGNRSRAQSVTSDSSAASPLEALTQQLDQVYKLLGSHGLDPQVIVQVFKQVGCIFILILRSVLTSTLPINSNIYLFQTVFMNHSYSTTCVREH